MPRSEIIPVRVRKNEATIGELVLKQGLARYGGNFDLLDQNGHFKIPETPLINHERRAWRASLTVGEQIEFDNLRHNVLELFGVNSLPQIRDVMADSQRRAERTIEANRILARRFGIQGGDEFIKSKIDDYHRTAVRERKEEAGKLGRARSFELTNRIATTSNVLELLHLGLFSSDKRIKFEAGKILDGMDAAAAADRVRREEETARFLASPNTSYPDSGRRDEEEDPDVAAINAILDNHFYSSIPPKEPALLISKHNAADDFKCTEIRRIPPEQAKFARYKRPPKGYLYTDLPERIIQIDGKEIPAYVSVRKKTAESTQRKAKRKGTRNIRKAVEDTIGIRIVVPNRSDIPKVIKKLAQAFASDGHSFTILELQDSLSGGKYEIKNPGSSEDLEVVNIGAEIRDWRAAEIQATDYFGWVESTSRHKVSRAEFELSRLYDSGVPQHDFPEWIYGEPHDKIRSKREREIRDGIAIGLFRDDSNL